jgi:Carboxypeptidase regulatory-like domain
MRIERTVTKTLLCAVALASLLALPVFAQQTSGNLRGVVKDQNGAAVRGARITITDRTTNTSFAAETTSEGEFRVNNMPAGEYQMKIEAAGFRSLTLNEVRVLLNQTTDVPAQLTAGIQDELGFVKK